MTACSGIILAAGSGRRLGRLGKQIPKGMIRINNEPIINRSVRLLNENGVLDVAIVVGHEARTYEEVFGERSRVRLIHNHDFAHTGSFASLMLALSQTATDAVVLDSDIIYEPRGLQQLLDSPSTDSVLVSGFTNSGDEVWVGAEESRLTHLAKELPTATPAVGEFVGITRMSQQLMGRLLDYSSRCGEESRLLEYETALTAVAGIFPIRLEVCKNLKWREIDTPEQLVEARQLFTPETSGSLSQDRDQSRT